MIPDPRHGRRSAPHVVVVAYGNPILLQKSIRALDQHFPLVVVDNSSSPAIEALARDAQGRYIDPGKNLGFAAGVNLAIRSCDPDSDILLLNPDAVIRFDQIERLQDCLRSDDRLACVTPRQIHPESRQMQRVSWPVPSPWHHWLEAIGVHVSLHRAEFRTGSVLLLRREALSGIGLLDERFFMYAEETDWQMRAMAAGWKTAECPDVMAEHLGAGTATDESLRQARFHASHELLIRKHYGPRGWAVYRSAALAGAALRAVVLSGDGRQDARRRLNLYRTGPCRAAQLLDTIARMASETADTIENTR